MKTPRSMTYFVIGILAVGAPGVSAMEVASDAFRISHVGPEGNADYPPSDPTVAYNSTDHEYLIVWDAANTTEEGRDVYGQRIDAATGEGIGSEFRISAGGAELSVDEPAVVYNGTDNQFLVVWEGGEENEPEIYGQILSAAGDAMGDNFRVSSMGPEGDADYFPTQPSLAWNSMDNQYLVVWSGDIDTAPFVDNEDEIWGQRLNADGTEIGADFRISDMGPFGDAHYKAERPAVAYNAVRNEYLVVWEGDDGTAPLADNEFEIYGQRLSAATVPLGDNDFRISAMGPDGDKDYSARFAAIAHDTVNDRYLVVWQGDDDTAPLVKNEYEIFGQFLDGKASILGERQRLSDMGPDGDTAFQPTSPSVTYNAADEEFLVVWRSDDNEGGMVFGEDEIFGQRVSPDGSEVGDNDFRITHVGPDGDENYRASTPTVIFGADALLVIWNGNGADGLADEEFEVFGTFLGVTNELTPDESPEDGLPEGSVNVEQIFGGCSLVRRSNFL